MSLWLLLALLAIAALAVIALMTIFTIGHQSNERRPGHLDLTGIKPRAGYTWPAASRVRAQAGRDRQVLLEEPDDVRARFALQPATGEALARRLETPELSSLSEQELAQRVARGGAA